MTSRRPFPNEQNWVILPSRTLKKLIVGRKWKHYLAARSRSQFKANARFAGDRRKRRLAALRRPRVKQFKKDVRIAGPEVFSLIQNADAMISFFNDVRMAARTRNVYVDLSGVRVMTPDAIATLLATIHHCRIRGARLSGNVPSDSATQQMLNDSGFRTYVRNSPNFQYLAPKGHIEQRTLSGETFQNRFDQQLARRLIEFATLRLTGKAQPHRPSFSVFCEAMLNTFNHASEADRSRQPWWASVYFDAIRKRACFTFIDLGVGVFESHRFTMRLNILKGLRILNPGEILKKLFHGEIPSTTKLPGRGNGIPGMCDHCKAGRIKQLMVITNKAIGNAETETYSVLANDFAGTLVYWEI